MSFSTNISYLFAFVIILCWSFSVWSYHHIQQSSIGPDIRLPETQDVSIGMQHWKTCAKHDVKMPLSSAQHTQNQPRRMLDGMRSMGHELMNACWVCEHMQLICHATTQRANIYPRLVTWTHLHLTQSADVSAAAMVCTLAILCLSYTRMQNTQACTRSAEAAPVLLSHQFVPNQGCLNLHTINTK